MAGFQLNAIQYIGSWVLFQPIYRVIHRKRLIPKELAIRFSFSYFSKLYMNHPIQTKLVYFLTTDGQGYIQRWEGDDSDDTDIAD